MIAYAQRVSHLVCTVCTVTIETTSMLPAKRASTPNLDNDGEASSAKDAKRIKDEVVEGPRNPEGTSEPMAIVKDNVPAPIYFARRPRKENLTSACCTAIHSAEADIDEEMWEFVIQTSPVSCNSRFYAAHRRHVAQEHEESCAVLSDAQTSEQWNQMLTALSSAEENHENGQH